MNNMPEVKIGVVAVSRDCFPESLSVNRRKNLMKAYTEKYGTEGIYECPICIVESEIHMVQALEDIFQCLYHVDFAFYNTNRTFIDPFCSVFFCVCFHQILSSVNRKTFRETISADCYYSNFYFWHIVHCVIPPKYFIYNYSNGFSSRFISSVILLPLHCYIDSAKAVKCAFDLSFLMCDQPFILCGK